MKSSGQVWLTPLLVSWRLIRLLVQIARGVWITRVGHAPDDAAIRAWSRQTLAALDIALSIDGQPGTPPKLVVANHVSWLDIVAINAVMPSRFVAKAEIARWPLIGRMVTGAGSLYLQRHRRRDALRVLGLMTQALREGHCVAVFPEGTTSDGHALLPFHANMLQAAIEAEVPVQPLALGYSEPGQLVSSAVAFVGETSLATSLWHVLSVRGLRVRVSVLPLMTVVPSERRALAEALRSGIEASLQAQRLRAPKP